MTFILHFINNFIIIILICIYNNLYKNNIYSLYQRYIIYHLKLFCNNLIIWIHMQFQICKRSHNQLVIHDNYLCLKIAV